MSKNSTHFKHAWQTASISPEKAAFYIIKIRLFFHFQLFSTFLFHFIFIFFSFHTIFPHSLVTSFPNRNIPKNESYFCWKFIAHGNGINIYGLFFSSFLVNFFSLVFPFFREKNKTYFHENYHIIQIILLFGRSCCSSFRALYSKRGRSGERAY